MRDEQGGVVLPLVLGKHTLHSLGAIVPAYHDAKHIYPVGFRVDSQLTSYKHPELKVGYEFHIADGGAAPSFHVTCGHDRDNPIVAPSVDEAIAQLAERLSAAKGKATKSGLASAESFGLSVPTIRKLVQELPGAVRTTPLCFVSPSSS